MGSESSEKLRGLIHGSEESLKGLNDSLLARPEQAGDSEIDLVD
jgi:hypothetical protein